MDVGPGGRRRIVRAMVDRPEGRRAETREPDAAIRRGVEVRGQRDDLRRVGKGLDLTGPGQDTANPGVADAREPDDTVG